MHWLRYSLHLNVLALGLALAACGDSDATTDNDPSTADDSANGDDAERLDGGAKTSKDAGKAGSSTPTRDARTDSSDASSITQGGKSDAAGPSGNATSDAAIETSDAGGGTNTSGMGDPNDPNPTTVSATAKGPYAVKTYTSGYPDSPAYADSTMHYPDGATGPLPSIAIVPGFVSAQSSIQAWGPFLASHGIVTFTIGTNTPTDLVDDRAAALLGAIDTIKGENARDGSPLKGKLDLGRMGIGGWSMGGGGTLVDLNKHPEFKAAIAFCPWDPGATFPNIKTPTIFLAGALDELAAGQSQPFYESIPASTPKLLWERASADHFQNDPSFENGAMGLYGLSFLKTYLQGDTRYKQFLLTKGPDASDWRTNIQ